ncbi:MAG: 2-oxoacid:acceptor oxidoreductase subunit alpha [Planctomycetes bacterium]|nr:2-oxoacid:acceptor oxidoreductase subunit alpha [Planctomycetota bacterium]
MALETPVEPRKSGTPPRVQEVENVIIRFAGDSGDGMQVTGAMFTHNSAIFGNDISTFPDFPAEIRAPAGTLPGVSSFQLNFSSYDIHTPGDQPDVLVAMNPAGLKVNLKDLPRGGYVILNEDAFNEINFKKADLVTDPREDETLQGYQVFSVPITNLTYEAVKPAGLAKKQADLCKNMFTLGLVCWLYERDLDNIIDRINVTFGKKNPQMAEANKLALQAGFNYAETVELFHHQFRVKKAKLPPGKYRRITGNEATALGFVAASHVIGLPLFYGSYPITPASDILHELSRFRNFGVRTFQAEDEIAAMGAAIGASFSGALGLTGTSGPGVALKSEAIGLAVMTELPVVIANIQRGGPSTGLPTKTEQADLYQAYFGRNGECPVAIVAPCSPADCFDMAIEAFRIAISYMVPVFFLSDGYIANGSEPWRVPKIEDLPRIPVKFHTEKEGFLPYLRDERTLARPWALPGTTGLEHRIGGIEKEDGSGNVSYDPLNHEKMVKLRYEKVQRIADHIPELQVLGPSEGELLVLGWGSTAGSIRTAVERVQRRGGPVAAAHLRYLSPFPRNLEKVLKRYEKVLVPELNLGQLGFILRGKFLINVIGLNKVQGQPFKIIEIEKKIEELL